MVIRVNISELESKAKYADSLAKELKVKAEEINNIYYNLDSKVKSRNEIGQSILNLKRKIEAAYEKMYNISKFLFKAAENYRNAETQVTDKAKSLEAMFNFNNYNVMDSLVGLDINAINALEISNIDKYNVGTEYSTGKAKSSGFLGGLFSAGLGIGVSIAKNLFYDPAAMALAVSSTFLENLGFVPKGTAQSQYSKIKSLERDAEADLINKYVSNKAYYYGASTLTDFVSMGIGMAKAALGLQQIFAGMNGVATGIAGGPFTGGGSLIISVEGAAAVAVGLVQTGYGTSVFFSSKDNLKSNYKKFKEAISEGGVNSRTIKDLNTENLMKEKEAHVFSQDHLSKNIMDLGKNRQDIINSGFNIVEELNTKGMLKEGPNQIKTMINGHEAEIRIFVKDGKMINFDMFKGHSPRNMGNTITYR